MHSPEDMLHIIAGPTASGKSGRALALGQDLKGVVINADSMQVYKDLPVLTAQPSAEEQTLLPHKLYSVLDASALCNAAMWAEMAAIEVKRCLEQNQTPLLTGGTGFYIKALLEGLSPVPDVSSETRERVSALREELGRDAFYQALCEKDPENTLHPNDTQRVIHAFSIFEETGKPLTWWQAQPKKRLLPENLEIKIELIMPPRAELHKRIESRFDAMLAQGVLEEVRVLTTRIDRGDVPENATIIVAHGFRALRAHIKGEMSLQKARDIAIQDTKHYAKRQETWFRHQL